MSEIVHLKWYHKLFKNQQQQKPPPAPLWKGNSTNGWFKGRKISPDYLSLSERKEHLTAMMQRTDNLYKP